MRDWRPGRFSNAMKGFKHTSDELNKMDIDRQLHQANKGKISTMKHRVYGIGNSLYDAYKDFDNIFLDNIFWGSIDKEKLEKLNMLQKQINNMFGKLRDIYPTQIREDIGGAWWGFKNKDKDIDSLERHKQDTDKHFDSLDNTNENIEKAIRLIDIISRLLNEFIKKFSSYGREDTRKRNDFKRGLEKSQDFYDELNRYKEELNSMKDEMKEKFWSRNDNKNENRNHMKKVYMTENQLRACVNRIVKRSYRMLKENDEIEAGNDTDWRKEFMDWALSEHNHPSINTIGLMYDYYTEDDDDALYELLDEFGNEVGKDLTDDSQESNWIAEEIRRAINEWGYYNCNEDYKDEE